MICYFFAAIKVTIAPEVTPKALTVGYRPATNDGINLLDRCII